MTPRLAAAGVLALLISLVGCAQHSTPHSTLRRGLRGDVSTLDPQKAGDEMSEEVLRDLYEGLTTEGDDGGALPALAASWSVSDDGLTYTFRLHDDARWSNGDPVVAQDVLRDLAGQELGKVLTCTTDMAIGRHNGKIYSVASPEKPADLQIKGLSCGFIKVKSNLAPGTVVELKDSKRALKVTIETDVRPDRSARKALKAFL
jgi:hypothetical protein